MTPSWFHRTRQAFADDPNPSTKSTALMVIPQPKRHPLWDEFDKNRNDFGTGRGWVPLVLMTNRPKISTPTDIENGWCSPRYDGLILDPYSRSRLLDIGPYFTETGTDQYHRNIKEARKVFEQYIEETETMDREAKAQIAKALGEVDNDGRLFYAGDVDDKYLPLRGESGGAYIHSAVRAGALRFLEDKSFRLDSMSPWVSRIVYQITPSGRKFREDEKDDES